MEIIDQFNHCIKFQIRCIKFQFNCDVFKIDEIFTTKFS